MQFISKCIKTFFGYKMTIQCIYFDDLPYSSCLITDFKDSTFPDKKYYYYYDEINLKDIFYAQLTDELYKILHINTCKDGRKFVFLKDTCNRNVKLFIHQFKFLYDLV